MVVDRRAKIEEIREAVLKCRSTTRQCMIEDTKADRHADDVALERVWTLLAELERDVTQLD